MKYIINPCNACSKNEDINDLNSCYTDTLAAYQRYPNNFVILNGNATGNWYNCMQNKMKQLPKIANKERNFSNFQINVPPVFVGNHFFPQKLKNTEGDKDEALKLCLQECNNVKQKNTCIKNCKTDFDALTEVIYETFNEKSTYPEKSTEKSTSPEKSISPEKSTSPENLYLIILVVLIVAISINLYFLIK